MKAKHAALVEALDGMFGDHHGELAAMLLDQIALLDRRIAAAHDRASRSWPRRSPPPGASTPTASPAPDAGTGPDAAVLPAADRLDEIPGISPDLARADHRRDRPGHDPVPDRRPPGVLGRAVPVRPPVRRPAPGREEGPGQHLPERQPSARPPTPPPAPTPSSASATARIARRRGKAKAQVAVARSILVIIWHLLADPAARFTDLGPGYYHARTDKDRKIKNHIRQIEALLGHTVTITPRPPDPYRP